MVKEIKIATESPQGKLKTRLLTGQLDPRGFVDAIRDLDQSNPTRDHSEANVSILTDPEVKHLLEADDKASLLYHSILSLSHFHVAQRKLMEGDSAARESLQCALLAAKQIEEEGFDQWCGYIEATIAYMDGNRQKLESIESMLEEGPNRNIVRNMIRGLKKRGGIDYKEDYNNKRESE
ncbi:hypothetical protein FJZ48_04205 [Candidatus Uhrbacteria bacterium]|nr:hypothetical protein [Candidatus Uhrbacteria bacterium]